MGVQEERNDIKRKIVNQTPNPSFHLLLSFHYLQYSTITPRRTKQAARDLANRAFRWGQEEVIEQLLADGAATGLELACLQVLLHCFLDGLEVEPYISGRRPPEEVKFILI